ncbi:hypothetical protein BD779DRAFT_1495535 [Infundibulicybe gibba]|nr:hypothetical protein BD779DRAFT_1495535 [Infundibulicybe gibba]
MVFMLGRLTHRVRANHSTLKHGCSRYYSSANYPLKASEVRVLSPFPFALSAEEAIIQMAPIASVVYMFKNIVGSLGARYLPGFVYFPAWVVDAEVQASVSVTSDREEVNQRTVVVQFQNSYVLSMVSLWPNDLQGAEAVPFTKELETQYGTEVSCLPYTISPSPLQAIVNDKIRFTPSSFTPNMLAAYPVLIPLYLAQYEHSIPGLDNRHSITAIMEAYSSKGRILTEKIGAEFGAALRDQLPVARGEPAPFARLTGLSIVPEGHGLDSGSPGTAQKLSGTGIIDFDDPRIRELVPDEAHTNRAWMAVSKERDALRAVVDAMTFAQEGDIEIIHHQASSAHPQDLVKSATDSLRTRADELTKTREETKPAWWKEWEGRRAKIRQ